MPKVKEKNVNLVSINFTDLENQNLESNENFISLANCFTI